MGTETLPKFRKKVDGYWVGARAKEILCGCIYSDGHGLTKYHKEAERLYRIGWLKEFEINSLFDVTTYWLSPAGERVRAALKEQG